MLQFLFFTLLFFSSFLLFSCKGTNRASFDQSQTLLIPALEEKIENLIHISIKFREKNVSLIQKDGAWYLDDPYHLTVDGQFINLVLGELTMATLGQSVPVERRDYDSLLLSSSTETKSNRSGIEVLLEFSDGFKFEMILGEFDIPENSEDAQFYGQEAVARRYVRLLPENSIFLIDSSFSVIDPTVSNWEDRQFPPLRRVKKLVFTDSDGFSWTASRASSYAPIKLNPPFEGVRNQSKLVQIFEDFLGGGLFEASAVTFRGGAKESANDKISYTVMAEDRFGGTYHLEIFGKSVPDKTPVPRDRLQEGSIAMGGREEDTSTVICRLSIEMSDPDRQTKNRIDGLKNRKIHMPYHEFKDLEQFTQFLKNEHKKQ